MALGGLGSCEGSYGGSFARSDWAPLMRLVRGPIGELERWEDSRTPNSKIRFTKGLVTGRSVPLYLGSGSGHHDSASDAVARDMRGAVSRNELYSD